MQTTKKWAEINEQTHAGFLAPTSVGLVALNCSEHFSTVFMVSTGPCRSQKTLNHHEGHTRTHYMGLPIETLDMET